MSDSWISENEVRMDMADEWVSHAQREGIQEEWFRAYDGDEIPYVKSINIWIDVVVDSSMTPKEVKQLLLDKLNKEEWEFE